MMDELELKIYELSLIWKEAEYNFAFWNKFDKNFHWDEEYKKALSRVIKTKNTYEYYLELMRFVALLKDGHTGVWFPNEIYNSEEYASTLPIFLQYINDEYIITNVKKVVENQVKRFSKIKKINGEDINQYIEKNIYPYIWHEKKDSSFYEVNTFLSKGTKNSKVEFVLECESKEYSVTLERTYGDTNWAYKNLSLKKGNVLEKFKSDSHTIEMTEDGIAIITIKTMMNNNLPKEIYENYPILKEAKGYIVDIRDNRGGNSLNSDAVASLFIGKPFENSDTYHPIHIGAYKAWGKDSEFNDLSEKEFYETYPNDEFREKIFKILKHTYYEHNRNIQTLNHVPGKLEGPIVILSSEYTASEAENFINVMKYHTNAKIIGTASFGSTGQPLTYQLESGEDLEFVLEEVYL